MTGYVITAKPNAWQRFLRAAGPWLLRFLTRTGLLLLGIAVFLLRMARAVFNLIVFIAARLEIAAAQRAGQPPIGSALGVGITEAFLNEFADGFTTPTTDGED